MEIYLDLLIIFNSLFDYVLLSSVNYILRRNVSFKRILLSSLLGNISLLLLEVNNGILFFLLKILGAVVINIVCFGYRDFKNLVKNVTYFYLVSMLMGGVVYFFKSQFIFSDGGLILNSDLFKYLVVIFVSLLVIYLYLFKFKELRNQYSSYYNCLIYLDDNNSVRVSGFLDTGNKLKDPYSNKNIILVNKSILGDLKLINPLYVPYNSLNNHGLLECFKVNKIVIDGKENSDFLLGISEENMFIDGIDCILNVSIMEGLR